MASEIKITTVRQSTCVEIEGAVDVGVEYDGFTGEVTLCPRQADGELDTYGVQPDHWVSNGLLSRLRRLDDEAFREELRRIKTAAIEAASEAE